MVINLTTKHGVFGNPDGTFSVIAKPGSKIVFSAKRYHSVALIVPANVKNCTLDTIIHIQPISHSFMAVEIHPIKTLAEIKEERQELAKEETRTVKGVDVLSSPITALYERFSKQGRSKRKVAEMEHQDKKDDIVKELLRTYVSYDVIYLKEDQFRDFIHFLKIDDYFLKSAADYELIIYIQRKLEEYKQLHPEIFPKN